MLLEKLRYMAQTVLLHDVQRSNVSLRVADLNVFRVRMIAIKYPSMG